MTRVPIPSPDDVHITRHPVEQLVLRFPSDLLQRSSEAYLRGLLGAARPAFPSLARRYRLSLRPGTLLLQAEDWILSLVPNRPGATRWALVTALRRDPAANTAPRALRLDRLCGHAAFASGDAFRLLASLILEIGVGDTERLARLWRERRYPLVLWGGYETFAAFCRDARRPSRKGPPRVIEQDRTTRPAGLTRRQAEILRALAAYRDAHGYPPSLRDLGRIVGLRSLSTISAHVHALERKGYIHREPRLSRTIVIIRTTAEP